MQHLVSELQAWYTAQCDGDWEHDYGVQILTLDNPGWGVVIDLHDTLLEEKEFSEILRGDSENGPWLRCAVKERQFTGYGDPTTLEEILSIFLGWAKSEPNWLGLPQPMTDADFEVRDDGRFWKYLGKLEESDERCTAPSCNHRRVRYSIFCRAHHFEQMTKKPAPTDN